MSMQEACRLWREAVACFSTPSLVMGETKGLALVATTTCRDDDDDDDDGDDGDDDIKIMMMMMVMMILRL